MYAFITWTPRPSYWTNNVRLFAGGTENVLPYDVWVIVYIIRGQKEHIDYNPSKNQWNTDWLLPIIARIAYPLLSNTIHFNVLVNLTFGVL